MSYTIDSFPGREVTMAGKTYRYFGGTSYLGLQTHTGFQDLFIKNIRKYGTNYGASRKANIKLEIFERAEVVMANLVGSQACTTLSSGYLAGKLVAQHFDNDAFKCFYAPNTHSAVFQKNTVPYKNFIDLERYLKEFKESGEDKTPVVFIDSIDTIEASYPSFEGLKRLPINEMILVCDDSHGIGILCENGGGAYTGIQKLGPGELLVCCSLGKGFGIQAGAIFGTENRIEQLTKTEFFGGASPAAPAALSTFFEGQTIYEQQRVLLKKNLRQFLRQIQDMNRFHFIHDHPVFVFQDSELAAYLETHGFLTTNFKYPNDEGVLMSRIVISAAHTETDIELLATVLNSFKQFESKS
jgi:7-keto-8-aminopelargonate synthetase-like enzyme